MQTLIEQIKALPQTTTSEGETFTVATKIARKLALHGFGDIAEQLKTIANPSGYYYINTGRDFALASLRQSYSFVYDPTACRYCGAHPESRHVHADMIFCSSGYTGYSCWEMFIPLAERGEHTPYEQRYPQHLEVVA